LGNRIGRGEDIEERGQRERGHVGQGKEDSEERGKEERTGRR